MRQREYFNLISRQRRGAVALLLRALLRVLSWWYALGVLLRLAAYRLRLLKPEQVDAPVICVGNLTTGGTGKTPAVAWVVNRLKEEGRKPGIVSRGYKSDATGNDELKVLGELCPDVPHVQDPIRPEGARKAITRGADVIVLDDGFSHLPLARDLDILLFDALNPFGFGRMLPRGLLREPIRSVRRAKFCVFTRADVAKPERLQDLEDTVRCKGFVGGIAHAAHVPVKLKRLDADGDEDPAWLEGKTVAAFCGLGHPLGFRRTLEHLGSKFTPLEVLQLDDHQDFSEPALRREVEPFVRACVDHGAEVAVCTQKDAVKFRHVAPELGLPVPLYELQVDFRIVKGEAELIEAIRNALNGKPA
jgi:tetraacyldisaccharide 4'-kinase